ncbi:Rrf2 family transcriptional regulator [Goodfellowiella coeruleoviolacea]|uniref:Transcriptional regulator, BadM/Rrf2 family n=1 Tax=Goodfellowiella coeruleoviolacea TaxID=334858 RepID=A0AAE3GFF6_9PSEU|nr:Rrf2 family transcriptional regulator [Goodfellowiella coeruleoviolacea]MCP2167206.1 transcriptional regulator, BadM/Rrf2 family [Goodfellowiella coeruleoviolacea]
MSANSRLTVAVHVLTWMALARGRGRELVTSDQIATSVNTNPVVIRRTLGQLRAAGLVAVQHGTGAGWRLARAPEELTLLQVHDAVERDQPLFGLHANTPNLDCPVGRGIRPALTQVYDQVADSMKRELARTSIADVLRATLAA